MGAWGHGHFENDSALDFVGDIEDSKNPKQLFIDTLDNAVNSDYLDSDDACYTVVTSAYIDSQVSGTRYTSVEDEEPMNIDTFISQNPSLDLADLKDKAVSALKRVVGDDSELKELWEENEEDYPLWRSNIEQLISRLSK
ncbi:MAG: DUF4259 domain-containing protein [Ferruginibacter sp.]